MDHPVSFNVNFFLFPTLLKLISVFSGEWRPQRCNYYKLLQYCSQSSHLTAFCSYNFVGNKQWNYYIIYFTQSYRFNLLLYDNDGRCRWIFFYGLELCALWNIKMPTRLQASFNCRTMLKKNLKKGHSGYTIV